MYWNSDISRYLILLDSATCSLAGEAGQHSKGVALVGFAR